MMNLAMQLPSGNLSESTYVSIGLLLVLVSGVWWLGRLLGKIEMALFQLKVSLERLKSVPSRLSHLENHMMALEEDLNNLWFAVRTGGEAGNILPQTRRSIYRPLHLEDPSVPPAT
jgi:hypothetical protein